MAIALLLLPGRERMKYQGLKHDCANTGIWLHDRLDSNERPIDLAFLGSSRTINGIDDALVDSLLGPEVSCVNFGYCRYGRNLTYHLAQKLILSRAPKTLVVEVREEESTQGHPIYPYLCSDQDVFWSYPLLHKRYFADIYTHFSYKIQLNQAHWYRSMGNGVLRWEDHGFAPSKGVISPEDAQVALEESGKEMTPSRVLELLFPKYYIEQLAQLCSAYDVELIFLYMGGFKSASEEPGQLEFYEQFGKVIVPGKDHRNLPGHFHDRDHYNEKGANKFSHWLGEKLNEMIDRKPKKAPDLSGAH